MDRLRQRTVRGTQKAAQGTKKAVQTVAKTALRTITPKKSSVEEEEENPQSKDGVVVGEDVPQNSDPISADDDPKLLKDSSTEESSASNRSKTVAPGAASGTVLEVGPVLEFLTADTTLFWIFCLVAAVYPTVQHVILWTSAGDHGSSSSSSSSTLLAASMPLSVVGPWLVLAFATGQVAGQWMGSSTHYGLDSLSTNRRPEPFLAAASATASSIDTLAVAEEQRMLMQMDQEKTKKHSLFMSLVGSRAKIRFTNIPETASQILRRASAAGRGAWTTLGCKGSAAANALQLPSWQVNMDPLKDEQNKMLVQRLLQRGNLRIVRKSAKQPSERIDTDMMPVSSADEVPASISSGQTTKMGAMDLAVADSLDDLVTVEPLFQLRGMDVFLTDDSDPEADVGTHPWLVAQGLRAVPTFTINVLTMWGNILIYFTMPAWVDSLKPDAPCLEDKSTDSDETRSLKRFLRCGDDYRNARLMMIPCVVEGPMPVRMVAPQKKEICVNGNLLQLEWKSLEGDGNKHCPHLEVTLDCMKSRPIRSMASLIKKYLQKLSIDVAVVVDKPLDQTEAEPSGCLGIWRFDHVDVSQCPQLPDRFAAEAEAEGQSPDVLRASRMLGLSKQQLQELVVEVQ